MILHLIVLLLTLPFTSYTNPTLPYWMDVDMIQTGSITINVMAGQTRVITKMNFLTVMNPGYIDLFGINNCAIQSDSTYYKLQISIFKKQLSSLFMRLKVDTKTTEVGYKFAYMIINHPDIIASSQKLSSVIFETIQSDLIVTKLVSAQTTTNPKGIISLITFIEGNLIPEQLSFSVVSNIEGNSIQVKLIKKQGYTLKLSVVVYIINTQILSNYKIFINNGTMTKGVSLLTDYQQHFPFSSNYMINSFIFSITEVHMNKSKNWYLTGSIDSNAKKVVFNYKDSLNVQFSINYLRFRKCSENHPYYLSSTDGCICNTKYYPQDNQCLLCDDKMRGCDTCKTQTQCDTCFAPNNTRSTITGEYCSCNTILEYHPFDLKCVHCSDLIFNCTSCSDNQTCIICQDKYYQLNKKCQNCDEKCLTCNNSADYCLTCNQTAHHIHKNNKCVCPDKFYMDGVICIACDQECLLCNNTSNQCQRCIDGYYLSTITCLPCDDICLTCIDLADHCLTCDPNIKRTHKDDTCICIDKFYDDSGLCQSCNSQCLTCKNSADQCYSCVDGYYLSGIHCLRCNSNCQTCNNTAYFCLTCFSNNQLLQNNMCLCQVGQFAHGYLCLKCNDQCQECFQFASNCTLCNNTVKRIFNNKNCDCIEPFSDCVSSGLSNCNPKICSLLTPIVMNIIQDIQKDPNSNSFTYKIKISPIIPQFLFDNFSKALNIQGLPLGTHIEISSADGIVSFNITYFQNIQNLQINTTIDVSKLGYQFTALTPVSSITHSILAANNLVLNKYSNEVYNNKQIFDKVVLYTIGFGFLVFFIGLGSSRIVSIEMMGVNQISFFGLFVLNNNDPFVQSLNQYGLFNGIFEIVPTFRQKTPYRIFATGQSSSIISNINAILVLLALPLIACLICYLIHLKNTKYRIKMRNICRLLLGQWLLTAFIFILYNYSSSFISFVIFSSEKNIQFYINIVLLIILSSTFGILIWMYVKCSSIWMGEYKDYFNWNRYSSLCYLFPIFQRFIVGILITSVSMSFASSIISIVVFIVCIISVAIKKPFVEKYQNIRSIICNCYSIIILILYTILSINGSSKGQSFLIYLPYAINTIVLVNILTGFAFIIFYYVKNYKIHKNQMSCQKQQQYQQQLRYQLNKAYRQIQKNARNVNIQQIVQNGRKKVNENNFTNDRQI